MFLLSRVLCASSRDCCCDLSVGQNNQAGMAVIIVFDVPSGNEL